MKVIYYIVICCLVGVFGCAESEGLSNFSKRKYLKKAPKQKAIEQVYDEPVTYASMESEYSDYELEKVREVDYEQEMEMLIFEETATIDNPNTSIHDNQIKQTIPSLLVVKSTEQLNLVVQSKLKRNSSNTFGTVLAIVLLGLLTAICIILSLLGFFGMGYGNNPAVGVLFALLAGLCIFAMVALVK